MKKTLIIILIIGLLLVISGAIMIASEGENVIDVTEKSEMDNINGKGLLSFGNKIKSSIKNIFIKNSVNNIIDTSNIKFENIEKEFDSIEKINIGLSTYSVYIKTDKNSDKVKLNINKPIMEDGNNLFYVNVSNKKNELIITQPQKNVNNILNPYEKLYSMCKVTITIPENFKIKEFDADLSVGDLEIHNKNIENAEIEIGVGDISFYNLSIGELTAEAGVGDFNFKEIFLGSSEIEIGVGDMEFNGDINDDFFLEIGTGCATIMLQESENNYDFDVEKGIGSLSINGDDYEKNVKINNNSDIKIDINTGVGDVDIRTAQ